MQAHASYDASQAGSLSKGAQSFERMDEAKHRKPNVICAISADTHERTRDADLRMQFIDSGRPMLLAQADADDLRKRLQQHRSVLTDFWQPSIAANACMYRHIR